MLSVPACLFVRTFIQYNVSRARTIERWFCITKRLQQFVLGIAAVPFQHCVYRSKWRRFLAIATTSCKRHNGTEKNDVASRLHCESHPVLSTNGGVQRARAVDSTQVNSADRGLRLQPFALPLLRAVVNFIFHLTYELSEPLNSQILRTISMIKGVIQKVNRIV